MFGEKAPEDDEESEEPSEGEENSDEENADGENADDESPDDENADGEDTSHVTDAETDDGQNDMDDSGPGTVDNRKNMEQEEETVAEEPAIPGKQDASKNKHDEF